MRAGVVFRAKGIDIPRNIFFIKKRVACVCYYSKIAYISHFHMKKVRFSFLGLTENYAVVIILKS